MDLNAGRIYAGSTVKELGMELFQLILATASGQLSKSSNTAWARKNLARGRLALCCAQSDG